jgi:CopG family nickel-responsive transcriptional regulator
VKDEPRPAIELCRIGVAIPADLLGEFDALIERKGYATRSEAFRDLIRDALIQEEVARGEQKAVGTLTLVYDHHVRQLGERLTEIQHDHHQQVISTLHVHLDHSQCLEVLVLRGKAGEIRRIADKLIAAKGVQHGKLTLTVPKRGGGHARDGDK